MSAYFVKCLRNVLDGEKKVYYMFWMILFCLVTVFYDMVADEYDNWTI